MSNLEVLKSFLEDKEAHTPFRNIINGCYVYKGCTLRSVKLKETIVLYNYNTIIASKVLDGKYIDVNLTKYSRTTTKIQHNLLSLCNDLQFIIRTYDNEIK